MPKIYRAQTGWRIKGLSGTSPSRMQAESRLYRERKKFSGLGAVKPIYGSLKAYSKKVGGLDAITGKFLTFEVFHGMSQSAKAFFRRDEPRRMAIIKAKQQKKLSMFI